MLKKKNVELRLKMMKENNMILDVQDYKMIVVKLMMIVISS